MSHRKVKLQFSLTGRTNAQHLNENFGNDSILESVTDQVARQFGARPLYVADRDRVESFGPYPQFFAAGWLVSDDALTGSNAGGSELVVLAHGESMASAQSNMLMSVEHSDWEALAKDIL